ncbi:hypothetical protein Ancab_015678, partial [Ancistrocladus abbreviatus]
NTPGNYYLTILCTCKNRVNLGLRQKSDFNLESSNAAGPPLFGPRRSWSAMTRVFARHGPRIPYRWVAHLLIRSAAGP